MPFVPDAPQQGGRFVPDVTVTPTLGPKDVPDMPTALAPAASPAPGLGERLKGAGEAGLSMFTGFPAQLAGRAVAIGRGFGPGYGTQEGAGEAQALGGRVAQALTYEPRSEAGRAALDRVGRIVGESKLEGIGPINPAVGGVPARAVYAGRQVAPKVAQAAKSGFALTPDDAGAGAIARTAAGLSGEPKLARQISNKNSAIATEKVAADLGLPKGAELSLDALKDVRKQAGQAYQAVRQTGRVTTDAKYTEALDKLGEKYKSAAADFPDLARDDVEKVVQGLKRPSFDANAAVDMIAQLRESADQAFRGGNGGLGKVYRGGADAIEAQLERHLEATGQAKGIIDNFRQARERIAKSYQAEKALVGSEVNPQAYAKALAKGKPLSGGAREVAEFARDFERSAQKPTRQSIAAPTWSDVIMTALTGGKNLGKEALMLGARPGTRALLSSGPYQRFQAAPISGSVPIPSPQAAAAMGIVPIARPQEETR